MSEINDENKAGTGDGPVQTAADSSLRAAEEKSLHDALLHTRLTLKMLIDDLTEGKEIDERRILSLQRVYDQVDTPIDSLSVVIRSREQFNGLASEAAALRRENEMLRNHLVVAREERDELIKANKAST